MANMTVFVLGDGTFGTFLKRELDPFCTMVDSADAAEFIILAIPAPAYKDVAAKHPTKHLINVCSVQEHTNAACTEASTRFTGIHPMFGPRSPKEGRTCILTLSSSLESAIVVTLFSNICDEIVTQIDGKPVTGALHDDIMRRTHLPVLLFGEMASLIVANAADIPDNCLPTSFKRLKALADQMKDMSPGTVDSIRSNFK